jgi:hypothetical protein
VNVKSWWQALDGGLSVQDVSDWRQDLKVASTIRRMISVSLILLICSHLSLTIAVACTCDKPENASDALAVADAVFTGHVNAISVATKWVPSKKRLPEDECRTRITSESAGVVLCQAQEMAVEFEIFRVWKGELGRQVEVRTDVYTTACGFDFRVGEVYLVYANSRSGGVLYTTSCHRTERTARARDDIRELGRPLLDGWQLRERESEGNRIEGEGAPRLAR